jgi:pimeloyl-ACP methyl ester carboxylesterase
VLDLALPPDLVTVRVPTTVVWGEQDAALLPALLDGLEAFVPQLTLVRVADASHWIVHERPDVVGDAIAATLAALTDDR